MNPAGQPRPTSSIWSKNRKMLFFNRLHFDRTFKFFRASKAVRQCFCAAQISDFEAF